MFQEALDFQLNSTGGASSFQHYHTNTQSQHKMGSIREENKYDSTGGSTQISSSADPMDNKNKSHGFSSSFHNSRTTFPLDSSTNLTTIDEYFKSKSRRSPGTTDYKKKETLPERKHTSGLLGQSNRDSSSFLHRSRDLKKQDFDESMEKGRRNESTFQESSSSGLRNYLLSSSSRFRNAEEEALSSSRRRKKWAESSPPPSASPYKRSSAPSIRISEDSQSFAQKSSKNTGASSSLTGMQFSKAFDSLNRDTNPYERRNDSTTITEPSSIHHLTSTAQKIALHSPMRHTQQQQMYRKPPRTPLSFNATAGRDKYNNSRINAGPTLEVPSRNDTTTDIGKPPMTPLDKIRTQRKLNKKHESPTLFPQTPAATRPPFVGLTTPGAPLQSPGLMRNFQTPGAPPTTRKTLLPEAFMTPIQNEFFRSRMNESVVVQKETRKQTKKKSRIEDEKSRACALLHQGEFDSAIKTAQHVLKRVESNYGEGHVDAVYLKLLLGEAYTHSGRFKQAYQHLSKAQEIIERTSHCFEFTLYAVICYNDLGYLLRLQGNLEAAFEMYTRVLRLKSKQFGEDSHEVATTLNDIGLVLTSLGRFREALSVLTEALRVRSLVLGELHIDTATVLNNLGNTYMYLAKYEEALNYYRKGQHIMEHNQLHEHPDMATCYNNIGSALKELQQYDEARAMYEQARELRERTLGHHHSNTAACYLLIGMLLVAQKEYDNAIEYIEHARKVREMVLGENDVETALCYSYAGHILMLQKSYDQALFFYGLARKIDFDLYGNNHPETVQCDENIANLKLQLGYTQDALKLMYRIAKYKKQFHGENHPCTATVYNNIGNILRSQGKNDSALRMYRKAKKIYETVYGFFHDSTSVVYANVGHVHFWNGNFRDALDMYLQSNSIRERLHGRKHPSYAMGLHNLVMTYKKLKQLRTALNHAEELQNLLKELCAGESLKEDMMNLQVLNDKMIAKLLRKLRKTGGKNVRHHFRSHRQQKAATSPTDK